jgi:hypothetical protein
MMVVINQTEAIDHQHITTDLHLPLTQCHLFLRIHVRVDQDLVGADLVLVTAVRIKVKSGDKHWLRHRFFCASIDLLWTRRFGTFWQIQAGTPMHELQRLGGWRTGEMVERYAHLAPEHLAIAVERIDSKFERYDLASVN